MIKLVGDTHGEIWKLEDAAKDMGQNDMIIQLGDFGFLWSDSDKEKQTLGRINKCISPIVAFIDGNHENFNLLSSFPIVYKEELFGESPVRQIRKTVFQLLRGYVYTIDGFSFFTMGGAISIDKGRRRENISWWAEENPSYSEMERALDSLHRCGNRVDYFLTHTCPEAITQYLFPHYFHQDRTHNHLESFFNKLMEENEFRGWFYGHHHVDNSLRFRNKYFKCLYNDYVKLNLV